MSQLASKIQVISLTEHEFWGREFGADISKKYDNYLAKAKDLVNSGIKPVIQIGPTIQETIDLQGFPKGSLIVQFHADETYLPRINYQIIRNPAVALILRSYPIPKFKFMKFFKSQYFGFLDLMDNFSLNNLFEYFKLSIAGIVMVKRQIVIAVLERVYSKVSVPMPLGYNDLFAESFSKVNQVAERESLVKFALSITSKEKRKFEIAFVGQLGKLTRRVAIEAMNGISSKELILRKNYGGAIGIYGATLDSGMENVDALMNSKLALCPPGNYSNNTFRIAESLMCGAAPMYNQGSITDPISTYSYLDAEILKLKRRWKRKLSSTIELDQSYIDRCVENSLVNLSKEIERVKQIILKAQM